MRRFEKNRLSARFGSFTEFAEGAGITHWLPRDLDTSELLTWLSVGVDSPLGGTAPRALILEWYLREDLRAAFPGPSDGSFSSLLEWAKSDSEWAGGLGPAIMERSSAWGALESRGDHLPTSTVNRFASSYSGGRIDFRLLLELPEPDDGILVAGLFADASGLGLVARQVFKDLSNGVVGDISSRVVRNSGHEQIEIVADDGPARDQALLVSGADASISRFAPLEFMGATRRVGYLFWEVESPVPGAHLVDQLFTELWAPSEFVATQLRRSTELPVLVVPPHLELSINDNSPREQHRYFVTTADFHSSLQRKNPYGAIDAFLLAARSGDDAILKVKTINGASFPRESMELDDYIGKFSCIERVEANLTAIEMRQLIADASGLISLHRGEGLGLPIAEAMAAGVPVVATAFGGCVDFLNDSTGFPVPYSSVPLERGGYGSVCERMWAEPDLVSAAAAIRLILDGSTEVRLRAEVGRRRVIEHFSLSRFMAHMQELGFLLKC